MQTITLKLTGPSKTPYCLYIPIDKLMKGPSPASWLEVNAPVPDYVQPEDRACFNHALAVGNFIAMQEVLLRQTAGTFPIKRVAKQVIDNIMEAADTYSYYDLAEFAEIIAFKWHQNANDFMPAYLESLDAAATGGYDRAKLVKGKPSMPIPKRSDIPMTAGEHGAVWSLAYNAVLHGDAVDQAALALRYRMLRTEGYTPDEIAAAIVKALG